MVSETMKFNKKLLADKKSPQFLKRANRKAARNQ